MRFNINKEKLATEDPFKLLEGNENVHSANGKYMAVIERVVEDYLSSNNYKKAGMETCAQGLTTLYSKNREILGFGRHFNPDNTGKMEIVSNSKDTLNAISNHLSERIDKKIESYAEIKE